MYRKNLRKFLEILGSSQEKFLYNVTENCSFMFRSIRRTSTKYTKLLRVTFVNRKC